MLRRGRIAICQYKRIKMQSEHIDFENWMAQLPNSLREVPVINLAIPGSHDSGSCTISRSSAVSPDTSPVVKQLCKIFGAVVKRLVYNWVVTQHSSITEQLSGGIRYLDLRIATKQHSKNLYFVHGLYGDEISNILKDVREYLDTHVKEIVILDFQHFYSFRENDHSNMLGIIHNTFGRKLCPCFDNLYHVTLNWMFAHGYQVIVVYRSRAAAYMQTCWPSSAWPTPWPNTTDVDEMFKFLTQKLASRPPNAGYVTQCVLTPDGPLILLHPFSTLEQRCASICNTASIPWLEKQIPGPEGINVVIFDFFDMAKIPFCQTIIQLNHKLLKHNVET
ncbi:PI-PLC X domain-containing protein 3 [Gryllus bimaculatus]|nr:PI-PLC X domain-containing protein 3 [Gryllus bimaculatus]